MSPLFGGIGLAMTIITSLCSVYYNVIMAWSFYYMFDSFRSEVPWKDCGNPWNTQFCSFELYDKLHHVGSKPDITRRRVLSVVYFTATFPYVVLIILFFRGVTLPGAADGILFYLKPDFSLLTKPQVWVDAAGQIFFSLSVGFGGLITYGSYNKFRNNCIKFVTNNCLDTLIVSLINCGTSLFSGFVIFSVMGFMAHELGVEVKDVVKSGGPGLAFIAYPEGIKKMPGAPFWAFIFFFMLFNLGLDSQFVGVETVTTVLADSYKGCRRYKPHMTLIFCLVCYVIGISNITQ
ncbi:hypothetical protein QZH41_013375, partial [Actinostola sp. cb2023]